MLETLSTKELAEILLRRQQEVARQRAEYLIRYKDLYTVDKFIEDTGRSYIFL